MKKEKTKIDIYNEFIAYLNQTDCNYIILGNTDNLSTNISGDIDIAIDINKFKILDEYIEDFCKKNDLKAIGRIWHESAAIKYVVSYKNNKTFTYLELDFCHDYIRNQRVFLKFDEINSNKILITQSKNTLNKIFVLNNEMKFVYYLIRRIEKQNIDKCIFKYLSILWNKCHNHKSIYEKLNYHLETKYVNFIFYIFNNNDYNNLIESIDILSNNLLKNNRISILNKVREKVRLLKRVIHPVGISICFMGCDGAGKSFIIENIMKINIPVFREKIYYHSKPIPYKSNNIETNSNPQSTAESSYLRVFTKLIFLTFLFNIGFIKNVYTNNIKAKLVIFDRYFHDMIVDPKRYRLNKSVKLIKLISNILPKPNIWFFIDAPVKVIQDRKQEVTYEETKRQKAEYIRLSSILSNSFIINNNKCIDEVSFEIECIIVSFLSKRYHENK